MELSNMTNTLDTSLKSETSQKERTSFEFKRDKISLWERLRKHPDYHLLDQSDFSFSNGVLGLSSPLYLPDIEKAISYLADAINENQEIAILGDKDVDGVSSTALLGSFLRERNCSKIDEIVSDDGDDYGLSGNIFTHMRKKKAGTLIILLDMGSSNGPEIETLHKEGKKIIVIDHHQLHNRIANENHCAFINPQRNIFHSAKHHGKIATAGLVFKVLLAVALSHIKDWRQVYLIEIEGELHGFRCGQLLAKYKDLKQWHNWENSRLARNSIDYEKNDNTYPKDNIDKNTWEYIHIFTEKDEPSYQFTLAEKEKMSSNPIYAGQKLLAKAIETRPRLEKFVYDIANLGGLGTIADMVPLVDENRVLVRLAMKHASLNNPNKENENKYCLLGYNALIRALKIDTNNILSHEFSWQIAPAINAAGRMGNTRLSLDLLLSSDKSKAETMAHELVLLNKKRKRRTLKNEKIIKNYFEANPDKLKQKFLFCYHPDLEKGVSGIIASRLTEEYQRPVIYINNDKEHARGSMRSWGNLNSLELLDTASDLFIQFGGHPEAAGFSIEYKNIESLEKRLLNSYDKFIAQSLNQTKNNKHKYHLELQVDDLVTDIYDELVELEPFGMGNPEPIFRLLRVKPIWPQYMSEGKHVIFQIKQDITGREVITYIKCLAWKQGEIIKKAIEMDAYLDIYACLEQSKFRNWTELRLRAEKIELISLCK